MKRFYIGCVLCLALCAGKVMAQTSPSVPQATPGLYPTQQGGKTPQQSGGFQIQGGSGTDQGQNVNAKQVSPAMSAGSQVPTDNIQPVDNQAIMNGLASASSTGTGGVETARQAMFNAALDSVFPFSPDEIQKLFDKLHENQGAIAGPSIGNPKAVVKAETVPLEPGSEPKEIETEVGFVTTVSFLDSTGNPWPIEDIGVGGNFDVPAPEQGGNVIRITPLAKYAFGNMSIRLFGLTTPLSFKLRASSGQVYYRYDARVPKLGPKAAAPLIDHGNDLVAGDAMLMNILDGMAPLNSTRLNVLGVDQRTEAWRIADKVYVRTPYMLLSPGWDGSVGSGDGTHVYEIPDTPVLLLSDNGNLIHARIGNNAKPDEQPVPSIEDGMAHPLRPSAAAQEANSLISTVPASESSATLQSAPSRTLIRPVQVGGAPSSNNNVQGQPAPTAQAGAQTQGTQQ